MTYNDATKASARGDYACFVHRSSGQASLMDIGLWLLRLTRWWRHPPSRTKIIVMTIVVVVAAGLYTIEHTIGWPEWARAERLRIPE